MTAESGENSAANRVRMGRPGAAGAGRDRFGLTGTSQAFDPRVVAIRPRRSRYRRRGNAFRAALCRADDAQRRIACRIASAQRRSVDADQTSELLFGEGFALLDLTGGWAWGYCLADHYVGYLAAEALAAPIAPTHRVAMIEAMLHSDPDAASGGPPSCRAARS